MSSNTVSERELAGALQWIKELRRWAVLNNVDPWAVRQALLLALESDTAAALKRGIKPWDLKAFDQFVKQDIKTWLSKES